MNKILLEVIGLTYSNSQSGAYALILGEKGSMMRLPIIIGEAEAQSIAIALEGFQNKRPFTHDLFKSFATTFDINIKEVIVNNFKEGIFYSELHCIKDDEEYILDARTSDAVALAIRFKCPIFTYQNILNEVGIIIDDDDIANEIDEEDYTGDYDRYESWELESLLKDAVENEDYATASILRDEINKRKEFH